MGKEKIYADSKKKGYKGKILLVRAGEKLSLQKYERKHEAFFVLDGSAAIFVGEKKCVVNAYFGRYLFNELLYSDINSLMKRNFFIPRGANHRINIITDCVFIESSNGDYEDVTRIKDEYGREHNG